MTSNSPVDPYGSARDLPSVKEMEQQMAALKVFDFLLSRGQRKQLKKLQCEHSRITGIVDTFYGLLGVRNWVFTSDLNLASIEHVVTAEDTKTAEAHLIAYYKTADRIAFPLRRLHRFEEMRPRIGLLQKTLNDYHAGRYYSTVLVLLSVMDGFINDLDTTARRGLHARTPEDMVAWDDSVVGHHLGLSHAHQSFVKGFYKTDDNDDLFRNGIMHGTLVNFDNEVVATKAWNRLFAVAYWADSQRQQAKPVKPAPSLVESFKQWRDIQNQKARLKHWEPREYEPDPCADDQSELVQACKDFLARWQKQQWGPLGLYFMKSGRSRSPIGKLAAEAKDLFHAYELSSWMIRRVRHVAAATAHVDVELVVNGTTYRTDLRWIRIDDSGSVVMEWELGCWALSMYGPSNFLKREAIIE